MEILLLMLLCLFVIGLLSLFVVYKFDRLMNKKELVSKKYDSIMKG